MKALHKLYTSFLVLLAAATDRGMAKMLQYLKEENRTLRGKLPKRIELTPRERQRLVKLGKPLWGTCANSTHFVTALQAAQDCVDHLASGQRAPTVGGALRAICQLIADCRLRIDSR